MTNNNRKHTVSPSFVAFLIVLLSVLGYLSYYFITQTGLVSYEKKPTAEIVLDSNQVKLNQKDSIIQLKDFEIQRLKEELLKKPDTVYLRPKPAIKKVDTTSLSISKVDSVK